MKKTDETEHDPPKISPKVSQSNSYYYYIFPLLPIGALVLYKLYKAKTITAEPAKETKQETIQNIREPVKVSEKDPFQME